jgi:hypothetical protein
MDEMAIERYCKGVCHMSVMPERHYNFENLVEK